jgi:hypothetical protein
VAVPVFAPGGGRKFGHGSNEAPLFLFPAAAVWRVVAAEKFPDALLSCLIFDSHRLSAVDTRTGTPPGDGVSWPLPRVTWNTGPIAILLIGELRRLGERFEPLDCVATEGAQTSLVFGLLVQLFF